MKYHYYYIMRAFDRLVVEKLQLGCRDINNSEWITMVEKMKNLKKTVTIALVGKYVELHDAYLSVVEALNHGGLANDASVNIKWINAEEVNRNNVIELFADVDGILVPGGFGDRGVEGKIESMHGTQELFDLAAQPSRERWRFPIRRTARRPRQLLQRRYAARCKPAFEPRYGTSNKPK